MARSYNESHEWAIAEGDVIKVGLSSFAASEVGEVIHVELPQVGDQVERGANLAEVESVKSVNDCYSPVTGTIASINEALVDQPELINQDAEGEGWFCTITPDSDDPLAGLLGEEAYQKLIRQ